jgi:hypothetical protein
VSVIVPDEWPGIDLSTFVSGGVIDADALERLASAIHFEYSVSGCDFGGLSFDPVFQTNSTTFVTAPSAGGAQETKLWAGACNRLLRPYEGGFFVTLRGFGRNIQVRLTATRLSPTPATFTAIGGRTSNWGLFSSELDITDTQAKIDGNPANDYAPFLFHAEARRHASVGSGVGELVLFSVRELASSNFPSEPVEFEA